MAHGCNWRGDPSHATDNLIHWSTRDYEGERDKLRPAYDLIVEAGLEEQLKVLLDAAYQTAQLDVADSTDGECL